MTKYEVSYDGKADARPRRRGLAVAFEAMKALEDVLAIGDWNAWALVFDEEDRFAIASFEA